MAFADNSIKLCVHCGEYTKGKYCGTCGTIAGRKKIDEENKKIMEENKEKGFNIPEEFNN